MGRAALLVLCLAGDPPLASSPPASTSPDPRPATGSDPAAEASSGPGARTADAPGPARGRSWRFDAVTSGPRFLDHGVLQLGVSGGWPHLYRLDAGLGLFDHLAFGLTAHWLPGQAAPGWAPWGSVALWRAPWWSVGAHYRQLLHAPPDPRYAWTARTPPFQERTHMALLSAVFAQALWSVGGEIGGVHRRLPTFDPQDSPERYEGRWVLGGGVFARVGTPRWGVTVQAHAPSLAIDLMLDWRFRTFGGGRRFGGRREAR